MTRLNVAFLRALDTNADPVSGGKLYTYAAGTTTPVTTYSDSDLTTAQAHPVPANSAGEFPEIYVPDGDYKVVVKNAADSTLYEADSMSLFSSGGIDGRAFDTKAQAISDTKLKQDQWISIEGRQYETVPASTYTANGDTVIELTGSSLQAVLAPAEPLSDNAELQADTRPAGWFPSGAVLSVVEEGWRYRKVSDTQDLTTDGGLKLAEVGPEYQSLASAVRAVTRGDVSTDDVLTVGQSTYIVDPFGVDGLMRSDMDFSGELDNLAARLIAGEGVKIAVYGDSSVDGSNTTGWTANPTDGSGNAVGSASHNPDAPNSWPVWMQGILRDMFKQTALNVYNAGYGGKGMYGGWAKVNFDAAIIDNPDYGLQDYILIGFGLNDAPVAGFDPDVFERRVWSLCDQIHRSGAVPIICTPDMAAQNTERQGSGLEDVVRLMRKVADRFNVPIIDFNQMETEFWGLTNNNARQLFIQDDLLHLSNKGHYLKAGYAAACIFPNTLWLDGDAVAVPPWSKHCNSAGLTYNVNQDINNKFGGSMNVTAGSYTAGDTLLDLWVWQTGAVRSAFWKSVDGDGYYNPRPLADAPEILYTDVTNNGTATIKSATAGQSMGASGERASECPVLITSRLASGLSRMQFKAPSDNNSNAVFCGYFDFRKTTEREVGFVIPSGSGNKSYMLDEFEQRHELVGFGINRSIDMFLEATIPNGAAVMLWGGRVFTGTDYLLDNKQRAIMLYRNDNLSEASLYDVVFDKNNTPTLGSKRASGSFTFTAIDRFRINAEMDASGNTTITVYGDWETSTALMTYTVSAGNVQPPLGGRILPGVFKNNGLTGGPGFAARVIVA